MSDRMTDDQLEAWHLFHVASERLRREVGRDLWTDAELSEPEFTVLAHLALAEKTGEQLRPSQCARAIGWDSSRLAHQLRRLEHRGLILRSPGEDDGRASVIAFTKAGRASYQASLGPHLRSAKAWFADALSDEQVTALRGALTALMTHISNRSGELARVPGARE